MFVAILTNFGNTIYSGNDLVAAIAKVESAGFEATLQLFKPNGQCGLLSFSPIGGWKTIVT
jgi:hypothetical protein